MISKRKMVASVAVLSAEGMILASVQIGEGTGDRWARTPGGSDLFRLSSFRAERVAPTRDQIDPSG